MLGIYRRRNYRWRSAFWSLPHYTMETVTFGWYTIYYGHICRYCSSWRFGLVGLGSCLVILLSFGRLDCDWFERIQKEK